MNQAKPENRFFYVDFLRATAIFAVIVLHNSADQLDQYGKIPLTDWLSASFYNGLSRFCVPMFVLLSGSLLLNTNKETSIKELFSKRLPKLVIPLVFWSIVYVWFQNYTKLGFINFNLKDALIIFYKGPVIFHFWFLYMMIGIYLIYPIINLFIKSAGEVHVRYFLIVWFITNCILGIIENQFELPIGIELGSFTGYIGYFVLGYYLKQFNLSRRVLLAVYTLCILAFITSIGGIILLHINQVTHAYDLIESDFSPEIPFVLAGLFLFLKNYEFAHEAKLWKRIIDEVSKESYGIYIVHILIMRVLFAKTLMNLQFGGMSLVWVIPLKAVIVLGLSYGLVKVVRLVPVLRTTI